MQPKFARLVESPIFTGCLLLAAVLLGAGWFKAASALKPPQIEGWNWKEHPEALLISYPMDDCGCAPIAELAQMGLKNHLDVAIVSPKPQDTLNELKRGDITGQRLFISTNGDKSVIDRFSPQEKIGIIRIRQGRIIRRAQGGIPSQSFFE